MPSCDGIHFEHVLRSGLADTHSCGLVLQLTLRVLKGHIPQEARAYVYGVRLIAPAKPNEPGYHRPFGGGFVLRRVAFGFAKKQVRSQTASRSKGCKGGTLR